jgi:hypothetical protein
MQVEEWKVIEGYENYEISNFGRVRNINTNKILKANVNDTGYAHVIFYKNKKP